MLELLVIVRALALARRGHRELVLENLALRQQLTALRRTTKRAHLPILAGSRFRSPGHLVTIDLGRPRVCPKTIAASCRRSDRRYSPPSRRSLAGPSHKASRLTPNTSSSHGVLPAYNALVIDEQEN